MKLDRLRKPWREMSLNDDPEGLRRREKMIFQIVYVKKENSFIFRNLVGFIFQDLITKYIAKDEITSKMKNLL